MKRRTFVLLPLGLFAPDSGLIVYVGTYTREKSKGIYTFRFHAAGGNAGAVELAAETESPSFLAVHPNRRFLYAVSEAGSGTVNAFSIDAATGKLTFLNKASSGGAGPCYVSVDRTGRNVLVANYGGGSIAVLPAGADGRLKEASAFVQHKGSSVNPKRQESPHAHWINVSPDNRFVLASDLGLDQVLIYRLDAKKGTLEPNDPPFAKVKAGAGPRHFAFHPGGRFAYVINEIASAVTAFTWDAKRGALSEIQTVTTLPAGFTGNNSTAEVVVHPTGKFLYGSNRGHDSIAAFAIDPARGTLTAAGHTPTQGQTPRNFALDPSGAYLFAANQRSDSVVVFRVDQKSGQLTPIGLKLEIPTPVCVRFLR